MPTVREAALLLSGVSCGKVSSEPLNWQQRSEVRRILRPVTFRLYRSVAGLRLKPQPEVGALIWEEETGALR